MKQSIRLTRATLYFKFIAFRDLTSVRAGATPQRMFEKRKRHGETDVKVLPWSQWFFLIFWAFIVHCNASINSNGAHHLPSPSVATAGHLLTLSVPGKWHQQILSRRGDWALAYTGATPGHLTHMFSKDG